MKFLHTADWQIGMKAAHVGSLGQRVRDQRLQSARSVVQTAQDSRVDFILVAGDTFEDNAVDRVLVQKAADIMASFGGPVYVIPGNHDPLVPGSVWQHPAWQSHPQIHIITEAKPAAVPGGWLLPCPLFEKHSRKDPTAWIQPGGEDGIRIGLAHGSVQGISQDEQDHPIARDAAARSGLDYLALGHWHSTLCFRDGDAAERMAYSGTHETTRFGERDSGNALLVEIDGRSRPPRIMQKKTGILTWEIQEEKILAEGDLARVRQSIESRGDAENTLLELRLGGLLHPKAQAELQRIEELMAGRFLLGRIDRSNLLPQPGDECWWQTLPEGPLREAVKRLQSLSDPAVVEGRPDYASAEVAARALMEMYTLMEQ
jgi:DNA repair exonuclease SbcCD nuclease subunit